MVFFWWILVSTQSKDLMLWLTEICFKVNCWPDQVFVSSIQLSKAFLKWSPSNILLLQLLFSWITLMISDRHFCKIYKHFWNVQRDVISLPDILINLFSPDNTSREKLPLRRTLKFSRGMSHTLIIVVKIGTCKSALHVKCGRKTASL